MLHGFPLARREYRRSQRQVIPEAGVVFHTELGKIAVIKPPTRVFPVFLQQNSCKTRCQICLAQGHLRDRAGAVIRAIEAVVAANNGADEMTTDPEGFVPDTFWRNNEVRSRLVAEVQTNDRFTRKILIPRRVDEENEFFCVILSSRRRST